MLTNRTSRRQKEVDGWQREEDGCHKGADSWQRERGGRQRVTRATTRVAPTMDERGWVSRGCNVVMLCCVFLLAACGGTNGTTTVVTGVTATRGVTPEHYVSRVLFQGKLHPDDLAFTQDPNTLLFSDSTDGTINTITLDGKITVLLKGLGEPEGMVELPDKSIVFSEEKTNRILMLAPGAHMPTVIRTMPGKLSEDPCKSGTDDIAWDAFTHTVIVPDSPTGEVYSMSPDGKSLKLLASGMARPVDAAADAQGNLYVADQCGGAVWRVALDGSKTRIGGFGMPDALMLDPHGNLLVTDLQSTVHGLIRLNLVTGKREVLVSEGYSKPQGLLVDAHDTIYIADDSTNKIVEYKPV
jgi:hypothetical protein